MADYSHYPKALRPKSKKVKEKQRAQRQRVRSKAAQKKARAQSKAQSKADNLKQLKKDVVESDAFQVAAMIGSRGRGRPNFRREHKAAYKGGEKTGFPGPKYSKAEGRREYSSYGSPSYKLKKKAKAPAPKRPGNKQQHAGTMNKGVKYSKETGRSTEYSRKIRDKQYDSRGNRLTERAGLKGVEDRMASDHAARMERGPSYKPKKKAKAPTPKRNLTKAQTAARELKVKMKRP